jgi:hypothetical protein
VILRQAKSGLVSLLQAALATKQFFPWVKFFALQLDSRREDL